MKNILVDESIFVFAKRADILLYSELMRFLHLADRRNPLRKFRLIMTRVSMMRLGAFPFYHFSRYIMGFKKIEGFEKRRRRSKAALEHVGSTLSVPTPWRAILPSLIPYHNKRCLMDLFMYANEAKSSALKANGEKMLSWQVIPLEMCKIAQVAHKKDLPIFSFNTDFTYFCGLPHKPTKYIDYLNPESFLLNIDSY